VVGDAIEDELTWFDLVDYALGLRVGKRVTGVKTGQSGGLVHFEELRNYLFVDLA
jgi:hypothetical protein